MTTPDALADHLSQQGWVVVRDLVPPDVFATFKEGVIQHGEGRWRGAAPPELSAHPLVREVIDKVADNATHVLTEMLGQTAARPMLDAGWHYDPLDGMSDPPLALAPSTPCAIVALWALDDFTHMKGPTEFLPGSHRWMPRRTLDELRTDKTLASRGGQPAVMNAGSVAIFITSHTYHRAGQVIMPQRRLGLRLVYKGDFREVQASTSSGSLT